MDNYWRNNSPLSNFVFTSNSFERLENVLADTNNNVKVELSPRLCQNQHTIAFSTTKKQSPLPILKSKL